MARKKLPYKEGDWFAVPLQNGGHGLGRVARANGRGIVLGYFFRPRREGMPTEEETIGLCPADAVLVRLFGDPGLLDGSWPIVARTASWDRTEWPVPAFGKIDAVDGRGARAEYSDTLELLRITPMSSDEARQLPEDGLSGYVALQSRLTRALSS